MSKTTPRVQDGYLKDPASPGHRIRLDTPAWFAWLTAPTTTRFAYALFEPAVGYVIGVMTVRKERRQRGDAYWSAYRRLGPRLRKAYVGPSPAVTHARLAAVADGFRTAERLVHPPAPE